MTDRHKSAVLLIAHGSRRPEANADLYHVVEQVRASGRFDVVEAAFLELAEPGIEAGAARCVDRGATLVILVPYFLSAGVHVREDLAEACRKLSELHAPVQFRLAEPLGRHPLLLEVLLQRAEEVSGDT